VENGWLRVTPSCRIPVREVELRVTRSGGPGGQHANTSDTRVEARFDVATSEALGPRQRARLLERVGSVVTAVAADTRSQARNREIALDRLRAKLAEGLRVVPARRPTRPSRTAAQARLDAKRRQSARKRERRRPDVDS
jgi:ribosome-associated protein